MVKARSLDEKRRIVMPAECPPNAEVTIHQLDKDTWVIKRVTKENKFRTVVFPVVDHLRDDPEWDKVEERLGKSAMKRLRASPPEELD
ncbi:MAG: hypothetical protein QOJ40_148 [Verrucomicrobiota bacterium]